MANIGVHPSEVGIITPYAAQVKLIRELIQSEAVIIGSVDAFQGLERNVILVSTVRSFGENGIGYLGDRKGSNSALSRA